MSLLQTVAAAVLIAVTVAILREQGSRLTVFAAVGGGVLLVGWALSRLTGAFSAFTAMASETALSPYLTLLLKAIGVGYVVSIGADICRDLGAAETAKRLELCGRAELILLAIPTLTELVRLACEMTEGA